MTNENHKKYFAVNIFDDEDKILFFDTLDQAKEACLDNTINQCDYAIECDEIEYEIESKINDAVYGVILGRCKLPVREPDKDDPYESQYDYIIEQPVIIENNNWISVEEQLPEIFDHNGFMRSDVVLCFGKEEEDETTPTYIMAYMIKGNRFYNEYGECYEITHWQPLPPIPTQD